MQIQIIDIGDLEDGKCRVLLNGKNAKGTFGLAVDYCPGSKSVRILSVSPKQNKGQFKIPVLEVIAKEPVEHFA